MNNQVSVIITTKNEEKNIKNCLVSVKSQTYKNIEIIVVDNYSKDKTLSIASKYTQNIYSKGVERSDQRNFGIKKSKGRYILYLDADMIITPKLIEYCVKEIKDPNIKGLFIEEQIIGKGILSKVRNFERSYYNETSIDAIRFFDKDIIKNFELFDNKIIGFEDWDFSIRFNENFKTKILNDYTFQTKLNSEINLENLDLFKVKNQCIIHNEENINFSTLIKKKNYYFQSYKNYILKHKKNKKILKFQFSILNRLIFIFFKRKNFIKTLANFHMYIFFLMIKSTMILCFLINKIKK